MEKLDRRMSRAILCAVVFFGFEAFVQPQAPKTAPKTAMRVKVFDFPKQQSGVLGSGSEGIRLT